MNPLTPLTYYGRHKRQTLLLVGLIALMTLGVCTMVRLLDSLPEGRYAAGNYLTRISLVTAGGPSLDPGVVSQIRTHPGVAQVIEEKGLELEAPNIFGEHHLFGLTETDMRVLMETCDLGLKEGRLPQPRTNEMALTVEVANTMGLQIGDQIDHSIGEDWAGDNYYAAIPVPLELVGILESQNPEQQIRLGFVSYEYVNGHGLFVSSWSPGLVVIAGDGQAAEVEAFLEGEIASPSTHVMTHRQLSDKYEESLVGLHVTFGVVDVLVAVVMALVIAVTNQIAQTKRLKEFGLLNALGHSRNQLLRRLTLETAIASGLGWLVGLTLSWMLFVLLRVSVLQPRGIPLGLATLTPIWFSLPIPLITIAFVAWTTRRTFACLDAVAIVERGKFSLETNGQQKAVQRSSVRPLSSLTFYLRHRWRALILIAAMGLMILGVSFPAFLLAPVADALIPFAEPMRAVGIVTPRAGAAVDPGLTAQVRAHPTVAHVIPAMELPLRVPIPPLGWSANFYGVLQGDMQLLVERLEMTVTEGRLPQPRTNEIVLSEKLVQNWGWRVGDLIGAPIDERDHGISTELVIVGIVAPAAEGAKGPVARPGLVRVSEQPRAIRFLSGPFAHRTCGRTESSHGRLAARGGAFGPGRGVHVPVDAEELPAVWRAPIGRFRRRREHHCHRGGRGPGDAELCLCCPAPRGVRHPARYRSQPAMARGAHCARDRERRRSGVAAQRDRVRPRPGLRPGCRLCAEGPGDEYV
jgi:hypothetical protein